MPDVLMVASEATPFIKTGGLADVLGSLPAALAEQGVRCAVVLPKYKEGSAGGAQPVYGPFKVWLGRRSFDVRLDLAAVGDVPYYLVDCPPLFGRKGVYHGEAGDFEDNHLRFAVLSRAALVVARRLFRPRIFHCHDWQASLVPVYLKTQLASDPTFLGTRILLTIHNLGYQGIFPAGALAQLGLGEELFNPEMLEFYGNVNLLKGGIVFSDAINTVSRKYAEEIQTPEYGFGLDGLLRARRDSLTGILNGVDYGEWNPETDPYIAANYSAADLAGKLRCKRDLLDEFGFPPQAFERPLVGIVSRFVSQKGFDLLEGAADAIASENLTLVALGAGEARYEELFRSLAARRPDKIAVKIAYDNVLAHKIEAGSDIFLMPSRYEPCGLNQIYSMRYGTVPVVRATGGLDDTVDQTTGFKFTGYSPEALLGSLREALATFKKPALWRRLMLNGMSKDFSWRRSAGEYATLYRRLLSES